MVDEKIAKRAVKMPKRIAYEFTMRATEEKEREGKRVAFCVDVK